MTRNKHIIGSLVLPVALLFSACSQDSANGSGDVQIPANQALLTFTLKMANSAQGTRGTWSEQYDSRDGIEYENAINPDDIKVAIYDASSNAFITNVNIIQCEIDGTGVNTGADNTDPEEYTFRGTVMADGSNGLQADTQYKLMFFANCGDGLQTNSGEALRNATYSLANGKVDYIPMWGVLTTTLELEAGEEQNLGQVDLLRAMAKVSIKLDGESTKNGFSIKGAQISYHNNSGYSLPAGYANVTATNQLEQNTGNNTSSSDKDSFHPLSDSDSNPLAFTVAEDGKTAVLYIPEYDNSTNEAKIDLTINDGTSDETFKEALQFREYNNGALVTTGEAEDIVRNHIYEYNVYIEPGTLVVEYRVNQWNLVQTNLSWDVEHVSTSSNPFSNDMPESGYILLPYRNFNGNSRNTLQTNFSGLYSNPRIGDEDALYCFLTRPNYNSNREGLITGTAGARFFFWFNGPEGATWEAHLTNEEDFTLSTTAGTYFENSDYDSEESVHMATHGIARMKPYVIQVNARNSYTGTTINEETGQVTVGSYPSGMTDKQWEAYFGDEYLTEWGRDKWENQKVVDTYFYITVRLQDGTEYELDINPSYTFTPDPGKAFYYKDNRRYAGTNKRIWIRQLRALLTFGFDDLAKNMNPTATGSSDPRYNFDWWRVNPYWNE